MRNTKRNSQSNSNPWQNAPIRNLTATLCLTIAVLLGTAGMSFALPKCEGSPRVIRGFDEVRSWNNCAGTIAFGRRAGNKYVGEWKYGKLHGQGTYTWADGRKYVGEIEFNKDIADSVFHGQGTYTYANGDKYVGEIEINKFHGQGTFTHADGRVKEGIWKQGKFQYAQKVTLPVITKKSPPPSEIADFQRGALPPCPSDQERYRNYCFGTHTFSSGKKYVGEFRKHEFHGQGTYTYANGEKWVGTWDNGKRDSGKGTIIKPNGDKYVGEFKDGKYHGQGIKYHADGTVNKEGTWIISASPGATKAIGQLYQFYYGHHYLNLCEGSNLTSASVMKSVQKSINSSANSLFEKYKIPKKEHDKIKDISWDKSLKDFNEDPINKLLIATGFGEPMGLSLKQLEHKKNCSEMVTLLRITASQFQGSNQGKRKKRKF